MLAKDVDIHSTVAQTGVTVLRLAEGALFQFFYQWRPSVSEPRQHAASEIKFPITP
jgi:hypothetical protein